MVLVGSLHHLRTVKPKTYTDSISGLKRDKS